MHATLSPSSAHRWMRCPGSVQAGAGLPDDSTEHADEGTAAHDLAARCLTQCVRPADCLGQVINVRGRDFVVDRDMAEHVGRYVSYVQAYRAPPLAGEIHVEQRVPIGAYTGELGALGTADAIVIVPSQRELVVIDLKYGRGVPVAATDNEQLQLYALGALDMHDPEGLVHGIELVRLVIHQPRLDSVSEWILTRGELLDFAEQAREAAEFTRHPDPPRIPSEKACRWCKARATCAELGEFVQGQVGVDFQEIVAFSPGMRDATLAKPGDADAECLALAMQAVDLVELWCKAVRAETERRLLAGQPVPGYKLVQGKRGSRQWADEQQAEAALKTMRLKVEEMYDLKLISPTSAEKLHKAGAIGPRQWPKLQQLITQAEGRPSVAPEADKRPALDMRATSDDFTVVTPAAEAALA